MTETEKRLSDVELVKEFRIRAKTIRDWCAEHKAEEWAPMAQFEDSLKEADDWDRAADAIERLSTPSQGNVERALSEIETIWHSAECFAGQAFAAKTPRDFGYFNQAAWHKFEAVKHKLRAISQALTDPAPDISAEASAILRTLGGVPDTTDLSETDAKVSVGFLRRLLVQPAQGTSVEAVEAMREAAAKAICPLCASGVRIDDDPSHAGSHGQFIGYHVVNEKASDGLPDWEDCLAAKIRALPLPVSADGRDAVIEECANAIIADKLPGWAERRAINVLVHLKAHGYGGIFKSKQPDTGAEK